LRKHASPSARPGTLVAPRAAIDRDRLGVAAGAQHMGMTVQLICPWCEDEVAFEVDEAADEIVCSACGTRTEFAPDPVLTYSLLYEAAA
jgi:DNA-directed RNA polymerase subunit RPC12/RpoP